MQKCSIMGNLKPENIAKNVVNIPSAKTVWYDVDSNVRKAYPLVVNAKSGTYHHTLLFLEGYEESKFDEYIAEFARKYGDSLNYIENAIGQIIYPK